MRTLHRSAALAVSAALVLTPAAAEAFCGFYVSGADQKLFNEATQVVLMREGTRTVLSMQNNYQGPPESFAMIVPVPVVLQKENVKTLPREVFDRIEQLSSPRLVEYWEQDPCRQLAEEEDKMMPAPAGAVRAMASKGGGGLGVTIEAQFTVGEYEVVILSAKDSTGLDTWLRLNRYHIPEGAEPLLRPYVQSGMKFFVAKVDPTKVKFGEHGAMLSPLRFHYDAATFNLPIRLGLVNSKGTQDLIVEILARGQRYEVANYPNVTIPTNLDVEESARAEFGGFYAALFDRTVEEHPKAVVTEYAWASTSCDPCPGPTLTPADVLTLGADALPSAKVEDDDVLGPSPVAPPTQGVLRRPSAPRPMRWSNLNDFVLTRLHMRYGKDSLGEDLVFRAAPPIVGGREVRTGPKGELEHGAQPSGFNNFQARYAIRHPWKGPITCDHPQRGIWGGPPAGESAAQTRAATNLAFAPRGKVQLASFVAPASRGELGLAQAPAPSDTSTAGASDAGEAKSGAKSSGGCKGCSVPSSSPPWGGFAALAGLGLFAARRRRR